MRLARNIEGSGCEDCVLGSFCFPCTLCQMYDHLEKETKGEQSDVAYMVFN